MVYITGDIHGDIEPLYDLYDYHSPSSEDIVVLLGDVGANYSGRFRDISFKNSINDLGATFFCVHGNHENRPQNVGTYKEMKWHGGRVLYEPDYPNILFPVDGDIFELEGKKCIVIGGAYSVDKYFRLEHGYKWWEDEQPSPEIKKYVEQQLSENKVDVIFSHTCPAKYIPTECFLPMIDQSTVDNSTEQWLDKIESDVSYSAWYCGHWHTNKCIDRMHFLFHDIAVLNDME